MSIYLFTRGFLLLVLFLSCCQTNGQINERYVLVIHGGAGTILQKNMTPEKETAYKEGLKAALEKGYAILKNNGSSLDAVTEAVKVLEDNPLFNAGKGAVFTNAGTNEMDAAIMDGRTKAAGSVAGVATIKNPVTAARAVMEKSEHVMLTGKGAEQFAAANNCTMVDPAYFFTQARWDALQKVKAEDSSKMEMDHNPRHAADTSKNFPIAYKESYEYHISKFGTVGAVALDKMGNLAAATSTGGMTNKKWGRVGDAPIIGAGTYADNSTCAVSCTGWGEYFIRAVVAKSISDQIKYAKLSIATAAKNSLDEVAAMGGDGGLVALDKNGNFTQSFNTDGMYRGSVKADGIIEVAIYK
ncbi:MAG: isoaspartyl peptidase/L-asparaginase [Bacteroidota bacterium]